MDASFFPTTAQVRDAHPAELAVLLSTVSADAVAGMGVEAAEAVVVATQKVASWSHGLQAVAVDRFAEHVLEVQESHAAELVAARDAQRASVEASGGSWRGATGAVALPEPEQVAASMLAPELRISPRTMRTRLARARSLMELPTTLGLALAGVLEPWRVDAVVVASQDVAADRLVELEARLYASDVADLPKPRLVERARRAAAKADPDSLTRGVARAPRRRCLRVGASATTGLTRWSLDVPDGLSARMFAAVDALAQEYLTADQRTAARDAGAPAATGSGKERRTVDNARLDALADLVMANAHVETVVELLVPLGFGDATSEAAAAGATTPHSADQGVPPAAAPATAAPGSAAPGAAAPGTGSGTAAPGAPAPAVAAPEPVTESGTAAPGAPAPAVAAPEPTAGGCSFVSRPDPRTAAAAAFTRRRRAHHPGDTDTAAISDDVIVDLVLGTVTADTLAAGQLERHHGLVLGEWLETAANPFLTHRRPTPHQGPRPCACAHPPGVASGPLGASVTRPPDRPPGTFGSAPGTAGPAPGTFGPAPGTAGPPPGTVWFIDGLVEAPGASALLPEHITALLADPDTRLRITNTRAGAADASRRQRRTYRPGKALAATVRARDRHCRFPGCSVPAARCHLDHVIPFPTGETTSENLQCLCPAHHGFKHHAGWTVTMTPDGTCTWTTPTGRTHTTTPPTAHDTAA